MTAEIAMILFFTFYFSMAGIVLAIGISKRRQLGINAKNRAELRKENIKIESVGITSGTGVNNIINMINGRW